MRHVCCLSIAPTGTLSMVVGTGGSGCEPSFAPYHKRKERTVTRKYRSHFIYDSCIINELKKRNIKVTKANVDSIIQSPEWVFAAWSKYPNKNIDPINKIHLISEIYKYIKSVTVYRDKSRDSILNNIQNKKHQNKAARYKATHRPKELQCDIHHITIKGECWIVLVGLLKEIPYEIFCGRQESIHLSHTIHTGKIIKHKRENYTIVFHDKTTLNIKKSFKNNSYENAITRLTSLSLRHGIDIKYVVQQLERSGGDITTFAKAISRILKKYIIEGSPISNEICPSCNNNKELIHQSGCIFCNHCGWSRC